MERGQGAPRRDSEVEHVAVEFNPVDLRIVPLYPIAGLFCAVLIEQLQQFFIAADVILLDAILNASIILNPESNVPGLIIGPTVVGFVQQVGLKAGCGCHGAWLVACEL